jgi:hypothetical protein
LFSLPSHRLSPCLSYSPQEINTKSLRLALLRCGLRVPSLSLCVKRRKDDENCSGRNRMKNRKNFLPLSQAYRATLTRGCGHTGCLRWNRRFPPLSPLAEFPTENDFFIFQGWWWGGGGVVVVRWGWGGSNLFDKAIPSEDSASASTNRQSLQHHPRSQKGKK